MLSETITHTECPAYPAHIFIGGDLAAARNFCRRYCTEVGLCVTVTPADYIYTGGMESGVVVGLINYPRFPKAPEVIDAQAIDLAEKLIHHLCQSSATVQTQARSVWLSRRVGA